MLKGNTMETFFISNDSIKQFHNTFDKQVLALGCFDGLHIGHCEVIREAKRISEAHLIDLAVMTFNPHPNNILSKGEKIVPQLMTLSMKQNKLKQMGVDRLFVVDFTKAFSEITSKQFVRDYVIDLNVIHVVAGYDFTYGAMGKGNMDCVREDSDDKVEVTKVDKVTYKGEKISSTRIRNQLAKGHIEDMPYMLGELYSIQAFWDGYEIQTYAYCMLPRAGVYEVLISAGTKKEITEIIVKENKKLMFSQAQLPLTFKGNILIQWRKAKSFSDNVIHHL